MYSSCLLISSEGGDVSFQNNIPDPVTAGKELPTFRFELEKSGGRAIGGSYGKEATVLQLPISKGIAGVSMRMEPGVMRELHWHATAAEWAFVTEGRVRTTVIDPQGCSETNEFEPGDIWYSRAATVTSSRLWATGPAISFSSSITATSPNSAPSALPTGLATHPRSCSPRISAFRRRPSRISRSRRFISPKGRYRLQSLRRPCRVGSLHHSPTNTTSCPRSRTKPLMAASSGVPTARNFQFR